MSARGPEATLQRDLDATPAEVWALWTTRSGLERWFFPAYLGVRAAKLDLRPGGAWRLASEEPPFALEGEYIDVAPPHRLVMRTHLDTTVALAPHTRDEEARFEASERGTRLTLRISAPDVASLHAAVGAWGLTLNRLESALRRGLT